MSSLITRRVLNAVARRGRIARVVATFAFVGLYTVACDVHGIAAPGTLETIVVSPNPQSLVAGGTQQFTATGADFGGTAVPISPTWSIVGGGGAISATGMFTAGTVPGTYTSTVKATSGGKSGVATVTVTVGSLASITVTPTPDTLNQGGTQQYVAVGKDASGNVVAFTPTWSVVANGGSVSSTGMFTAGTVAGTFTNTVQASSLGLRGTASVTVLPAALASIVVTPNPVTMQVSTNQQFTAVGKDSSGNTVAIAPVWTVENGGGTIASGGLFAAGTVTGTFPNTVKAASGGIAGFATVLVSGAIPPFIDLGSAAADGILAGTAVSCTGSASTINANVGIWPGNTISGSCVISGTQHLGDPQAQADQNALTAAYNTAAGKPCSASNVISADLGGTTKLPGVYCAASLSLTGVLTLDGNGDLNATFLFQSGSSLTTAGNVVLINGAQAKNVFWQVGSSATLGTGSQFQGNVLALTSITLVSGTQLNGRALARNGAVSAGTGSTITLP